MLKWLLYVKVVTPLSSTERFNILSDHCLVLQPRLFSSSLVIFIIVFPGSSRELLSFTNLWQTHCTWPAQHQTPETGWWRKWFSLAPHYQSVCYHFTATSSLCANQLPLLITIIHIIESSCDTDLAMEFFFFDKQKNNPIVNWIYPVLLLQIWLQNVLMSFATKTAASLSLTKYLILFPER